MGRLFKYWVLFLMIAFTANMGHADEIKPMNGRLIGGIGLGGGLPTSGFGSGYGGELEFDGYLGFAIDRNLSIVLAVDSFIFNPAYPGFGMEGVNFVPSVKYAFGDGSTRFYLMGGFGLDDNTLSTNTPYGSVLLTQKNFVIEPGMGVQIFLNGALNLYLQGKFVEVFADSNFSFIPLTIGLDFK